jgi:hypothetical protein
MKTVIYLTILFFLILYASCEKENDKTELNVKNIKFSDCLNETKKSSSNFSCLIIQAVDDDYIQIYHHNSVFCCGSEEIDVNFELIGDTLFINEKDLGPFTYCFCNHDVEFKIGPLKEKSYNLKLVDAYKKDSLFINFKYSNDLNFTNCD